VCNCSSVSSVPTRSWCNVARAAAATLAPLARVAPPHPAPPRSASLSSTSTRVPPQSAGVAPPHPAPPRSAALSSTSTRVPPQSAGVSRGARVAQQSAAPRDADDSFTIVTARSNARPRLASAALLNQYAAKRNGAKLAKGGAKGNERTTAKRGVKRTATTSGATSGNTAKVRPSPLPHWRLQVCFAPPRRCWLAGKLLRQ
jgi:hypothetical protein